MTELVQQFFGRFLIRGVEDRACEVANRLHRVAHVWGAVFGVPFPAVFDEGAVDREEGFSFRAPVGWQAGAEAGHYDVLVEDHGFAGFVEAVACFGEEGCHVGTC